MLHHSSVFVGGRWITPESAPSISVTSPHSGEVIASVASATPTEVNQAVTAARTAFDSGSWPRQAPAERIAAIRRLAAAYEANRGEMAKRITAEMGAPITFSRRAQVRLPMMAMVAFCDVADEFPWQEARPGMYGSDILIGRQPVGVVAAVVPWNMPQFLTIGKLVPALLAGCTVVIKPSPEAALDAVLLAELIEAADLPPGVVSVLPGDSDVGKALVSHRGIDKVSFTGSTAAGRQVALACAANLKQASLELGGKSAAIVLPDADPFKTAGAIRAASMSNSGQVCNALTRILVPERRQSEFVDALAYEIGSLIVGDPEDPSTDIGPLVSEVQQRRVRDYIEEGVREGARLVVGGSGTPTGLDHGCYVTPTLFADADNNMRIAREEIFGPVLTVIAYRDEDQAIEIANDSEYGLAGAVFTADVAHGRDIASRIRAGSFGVNQGYIMDPLAPFGGMKSSGYGRELGHEGLESYLVTQSLSQTTQN